LGGRAVVQRRRKRERRRIKGRETDKRENRKKKNKIGEEGGSWSYRRSVVMAAGGGLGPRERVRIDR